MIKFFKSIIPIISQKDIFLIIRMSVILLLVSFIEFLGLAMMTFMIINLGALEDNFEKIFSSFNFFNINLVSVQIYLPVIICTYVLGSFFASIASLRFVSHQSQLIGSRLKLKLLNHYISEGWIDYLKTSSSEKVSRIINDATEVTRQLLFVMHLFSRLTLAFIISSALLYYNQLITSIFLLILLLGYSFLYLFFKPRYQKNSSIVANGKDLSLKTLNNLFGSMKEIIFNNTKHKVQNDFNKINLKLAEFEGANMYLAQIPRFAIDSLFLVVLLILAITFSNTDFSVNFAFETISIYGIAALKLLPAFQNIFYFLSEIQARSKYLNNIHLLISSSKIGKNYPKDTAQFVSFESIETIRFNNVSFSYDNDLAPAVSDLYIDIKSGKNIAIIGPSGSGKSTFVDLLLGLLHPSNGSILVNDTNQLNQLSFAHYRKYFSYAPQNLYLLEATLKENIIFGADLPNISTQKLDKVLELSNANTFINTLPDGINTEVSDLNLSLSGGQKQALGIARALYKDGEFLILDESTSNMDSNLEEKIMENILLSSFKSIIAITHKPSMLKYFDEIYVFNNGSVEAQGSYKDLYHSNLFFKKMIDRSKII